MPRLGDEFVSLMRELAEHDSLNMTKLRNLSRKLNFTERYGLEAQSIAAGPGSLKHDIFHGSNFTVLPHEAASMTRDLPMTIPNDTFTTITYKEAADLEFYSLGFDFTHGITLNRATGHFSVHGNVGDVFLISGVINFWPHATGTRHVTLFAGDAASSSVTGGVGTAGSRGWQCSFALLRELEKEDEDYEIGAYQDSGGDLFLEATFSMARIR